jgi:hypothetical protein
VRVADANEEGELVAAGAADLVEVVAGNGDHRGVEPDAACEGGQGGQRLQVVLQQVGAGGERVGVGTDPAGLVEQAHADRIQRQAPGREKRHVPPLGDVGADLRAGFQDEGFQAAVQQVGGGGQPNWASSDDHHRESGAGGRGGVGVVNPGRLAGVGWHGDSSD